MIPGRANEKIVQRILRHAKPHVTKDRYIKAFDPAVLEAMQRMQATVDVLEKSPVIVQQMNPCRHVKLLKTNRRRGGREAEGGGLLNRYRV